MTTTRTILEIKHTRSTSAKSFGENVLTLTDTRTNKKYKSTGSGYCKLGYTLGLWFDSLTDALHDVDGLEGYSTVIEKLTKRGFELSLFWNKKGDITYIAVSYPQQLKLNSLIRERQRV